MEINEETAASLGDKLAALDLTDAEGALLSALLTPEDSDEVSGFGMDGRRGENVTLNFEEVRLKLGPPVIGKVETNWSWGASQSSSWSWGASQSGV